MFIEDAALRGAGVDDDSLGVPHHVGVVALHVVVVEEPRIHERVVFLHAVVEGPVALVDFSCQQATFCAVRGNAIFVFRCGGKVVEMGAEILRNGLGILVGPFQSFQGVVREVPSVALAPCQIVSAGILTECLRVVTGIVGNGVNKYGGSIIVSVANLHQDRAATFVLINEGDISDFQPVSFNIRLTRSDVVRFLLYKNGIVSPDSCQIVIILCARLHPFGERSYHVVGPEGDFKKLGNTAGMTILPSKRVVCVIPPSVEIVGFSFFNGDAICQIRTGVSFRSTEKSVGTVSVIVPFNLLGSPVIIYHQIIRAVGVVRHFVRRSIAVNSNISRFSVVSVIDAGGFEFHPHLTTYLRDKFVECSRCRKLTRYVEIAKSGCPCHLLMFLVVNKGNGAFVGSDDLGMLSQVVITYIYMQAAGHNVVLGLQLAGGVEIGGIGIV